MAQNTEINLTKAELEAINDQRFFLMKQSVGRKTEQALEKLGESLRQMPQAALQPYTAGQAKISRGENLQGFPYFVLDWPRLKGPEPELALRTIFWWGHYFSFSLLLGGPLFAACQERIPELLLADAGLDGSVHLLYTGTFRWEQDLDNGEFTVLQQMNAERIRDCITKQGFLRVSCKAPLNDWDLLQKKGLDVYQAYMHFVNSCLISGAQ